MASKKISAKLNPLYIGPYEVIKRLGIATYMIKMGDSGSLYKVYNIRNLYPYVDKEENFLTVLLNEGRLRKPEHRHEKHEHEESKDNICGVICEDMFNKEMTQVLNVQPISDGEKSYNIQDRGRIYKAEEIWCSRKEKWREKDDE